MRRAKRFIENVNAKRISPTAKIDKYFMLPCSMSPFDVETMYAVIVSIPLVGLKVRIGLEPAARVTAMVSPRARERARMKEATMPESAAGTTIFIVVSALVAPRP